MRYWRVNQKPTYRHEVPGGYLSSPKRKANGARNPFYDGENGLLLTPNADHLFDRGFIGFENNGDVLISPVVHRESLARLGIDPRSRPNVGGFFRRAPTISRVP